MKLSSREALGLHRPVHRSAFHGDDSNTTHSLLGHSEQRERQITWGGGGGGGGGASYCVPSAIDEQHDPLEKSPHEQSMKDQSTCKERRSNHDSFSRLELAVRLGDSGTDLSAGDF